MKLDGAVWVKSTRSTGAGNGDCVEVATNLPSIVAIRDSKDPSGPALILSPDTWTAFALGVKAGDFDL